MRAISGAGVEKTAEARKGRFRLIVPLSCLLLTCCMAQGEAGARPQTGDAKLPQVDRATVQQDQPQMSAHQPTTPSSMTSDLSDAVQEGRMLLAKKPSERDAKKSKDKGKLPAKKLDASAEEEEEDEEDEEEDEEDASGKGSGKSGAGVGSRSKSIQADFDQHVRATLKEVVARGSVLSVAVSLNFEGGVKDKRGKDKQESEWLSTSLDGTHTHLLDYETGTTYPIKKFDGFYSGRMKAGQEEKTLRATFEAPPKNVKTVGITIPGIGTFDDFKLGSSGGSASSKHRDTSKTKDAKDAEEEEDEEDEEDEEEESESLTGKKGPKKGAK